MVQSSDFGWGAVTPRRCTDEFNPGGCHWFAVNPNRYQQRKVMTRRFTVWASGSRLRSNGGPGVRVAPGRVKAASNRELHRKANRWRVVHEEQKTGSNSEWMVDRYPNRLGGTVKRLGTRKSTAIEVRQGRAHGHTVEYNTPLDGFEVVQDGF